MDMQVEPRTAEEERRQTGWRALPASGDRRGENIREDAAGLKQHDMNRCLRTFSAGPGDQVDFFCGVTWWRWKN